MELICIATYSSNGITAYMAREQIIYNREQALYFDTKSLAERLGITHEQLGYYIDCSITAKNSVARIKQDSSDKAYLGIKVDGLNSLYSVLAEQLDPTNLRNTKEAIHEMATNLLGFGGKNK
jgi:hypothetical protein